MIVKTAAALSNRFRKYRRVHTVLHSAQFVPAREECFQAVGQQFCLPPPFVGQAGRLPSLAFRAADAASLAFASEQPGRFTISETGHYQAVNFLIFAFVSLTCEFAGFTR